MYSGSGRAGKEVSRSAEYSGVRTGTRGMYVWDSSPSASRDDTVCERRAVEKAVFVVRTGLSSAEGGTSLVSR